MPKQLSREKDNASKIRSKEGWEEAVRDTERKLITARRRVAELEEALGSFRRFAAEGTPLPGESATRD